MMDVYTQTDSHSVVKNVSILLPVLPRKQSNTKTVLRQNKWIKKYKTLKHKLKTNKYNNPQVKYTVTYVDVKPVMKEIIA